MIRRVLISLPVLAVLAVAQTTPKAPPKPKKQAKPAAQKAPAQKTGSRKTAKKPPAQTWRNRQTAPTKQRYTEIQQALADRGYLKTEPNGKWDSDSEDALKQFQAERNLQANGKINARSLIALGLGPKPPEPVELPPATGGAQ